MLSVMIRCFVETNGGTSFCTLRSRQHAVSNWELHVSQSHLILRGGVYCLFVFEKEPKWEIECQPEVQLYMINQIQLLNLKEVLRVV
jgi:hypothetical protein